MKQFVSNKSYYMAWLLMLLSVNVTGQSLFFDNYNQTPVNPIDVSGVPAAKYSIWTTVTPANDKGGTVIIEDYVPQDGVIKLLSMEHKDIQTGNRVEVSAPLSVYNAPFTPTLNANTKDLEWTFTMKQYRNSSGGATGFNGTQTGLAVVLAADGPTWGSQQGSAAKGYAVTFFKPDGLMYCASLSRFDGGLSNSTVLIGNKTEDVFSEFKTWVTIKVTYSPQSNEWSLYFRDEYSQVTKGDISNANGLKLIGSVVDAAFTNIEMSHFGFALNTPSVTTSANANSMCIDDFSVKAIDINTDKYKLNTSVSGEGDVSANPLAESHSFGSEVVLTATPREGYIFKEWSGDVKGFLNPTTVVVNADMNVVANFIPEPQEQTEPKKLIHFEEKLLEASKAAIKEGNAFFVEAYNSLISDAEKLFEKDANPVTNKTLLPASGDIHDYYSISPYFWPDPTKPDGLPWIYKDGVVNPASSGYDTDRVRFEDFEKELEQLIFAYYFSDDPKYAFKAMEYMDIWFVDEATKMNPSANYGSARPGSNDGDRVGVLNFTKVQSVITALQLFENKGILSEKTKVGVNQWIEEWSVWLQTSELGIAERAAGNNHGTWCDYQLMGLFLYEGDLQKAKDLATEFKTKRIASQIDTEGKQPEELARTKTVNYSAMNLWAMTWFAYMANQVDVDLWNFSTSDGRSIKKAYSFLKPYVLDPESWTWPNISNGGPVNAINTLFRPLFGKAITIFREDLLPLSENTSEHLTYLEKLQWPPKSEIVLTSVSELNKVTEHISVYPNPSHSIVNIEMFVAGEKQICVFNLQGQKVWQTHTQSNKVSFTKDRDLMPGIYIVTVSGAVNAQEKIVIQ